MIGVGVGEKLGSGVAVVAGAGDAVTVGVTLGAALDVAPVVAKGAALGATVAVAAGETTQVAASGVVTLAGAALADCATNASEAAATAVAVANPMDFPKLNIHFRICPCCSKTGEADLVDWTQLSNHWAHKRVDVLTQTHLVQVFNDHTIARQQPHLGEWNAVL